LNTIMELSIGIFNDFFDFLWFPHIGLGNYIFIIIFSFVSSCIILFLFKKLSNQNMIRHHRKRAIGYILQIRLYQDRLPLILSSVFNIFKHNILYLRYAFSPLVIILIPISIFTSQIDMRCGYNPMLNGQEFIVTATLADEGNKNLSAAGNLTKLTCNGFNGVAVTAPPVRIPNEKSVYWRARLQNTKTAKTPFLRFGFDDIDKRVSRSLVTKSHSGKCTTMTGKLSIKNALIHNAEGFLPSSCFVDNISIRYNRATYPFLFWDFDPLIIYFIITLFFAFMLKPFFGVTI